MKLLLLLITFFSSLSNAKEILNHTNECLNKEIIGILGSDKSKAERSIKYSDTKDDAEIIVLLTELFPKIKIDALNLSHLDQAWEWDRINGMGYIYKLLDLMNRNYSIDSIEKNLFDIYKAEAKLICKLEK
tara:strand:+ start:357 stop:749 length:393 start_codon:yes stop_codon:yes gene_type:complete